MTIKGVDVSKYQGDIDFDKLATKVNFIIIRGAAVKTQDPKLERNVTEAKRVGLPYGLFFAPIPPGLIGFQDQAYFHADLLAQYGSQIFPAFDLEVDGGLNKNDLGNWMQKYIKWFCYRSGITDLSKLMTYTRASWFNIEMPLTDTFWQTRLWLADWTPPADTIPLEWSNHNKSYMFWQTGIYKPATDYGCPAPPLGAVGIDLDEFYGMDTDFENLFGVKPHYPDVQPPPPPPPPALPEFVYTKGDVTNVRNAPLLDPSTDIGDLTKGAKLPVVAQSGDFYQFKAFVHKTVVVEVITPPPPPPPVLTGYYVHHDREIDPVIWRHGVPEVFHAIEEDTVILTEAWQRFILALNPGMTPAGFHSLLTWDRAFTNFTAGFDWPGDPHADYISGTNLDHTPPWTDKPRFCGGANLHGVLNGDTLTIETLNGTQPPPSLEWVLARPWLFFEAVTVHPDGTNGRFPQNEPHKVYFPLVASKKITCKVGIKYPGKSIPWVTAI